MANKPPQAHLALNGHDPICWLLVPFFGASGIGCYRLGEGSSSRLRTIRLMTLATWRRSAVVFGRMSLRALSPLT